MITAISRGCKGTLSDGVVRYVFDIEPKDAADAAKLFGMPGCVVVIAALTQQAASASLQNETIASSLAPKKPKGGALARLAGMWCADEDFYQFILSVYDRFMGGSGRGTGDLDPETLSNMTKEDVCRHALYVICAINSRAELDNDSEAKRIFDQKIRVPYSGYLRELAG